ncbi:MAG: DUF1569 domain-containing protein [Flavobacteriales bacterium]
MIAADKAYFLGLAQKLRTLNETDKPLWGGMTLQHMVEHVVGSWRISNGRAQVKLTISEEESETRRATLENEPTYPKNLANPMFANGLPPLRKASLSDAIDQLEDEVTAFFAYHKDNPDAIEVHPIYGPMDYAAWIYFQKKHMGHHLSQFGL